MKPIKDLITEVNNQDLKEETIKLEIKKINRQVIFSSNQLIYYKGEITKNNNRLDALTNKKFRLVKSKNSLFQTVYVIKYINKNFNE